MSNLSQEKKQKHKILVNGYTRSWCIDYNLKIAADIIQIIFMFFYIKFDSEYLQQRVHIQHDIITNIDDELLYECNTTVIGDWMDNNHKHVIKVKILDAKTIFIGIVGEGYKLTMPLLYQTASYYLSNTDEAASDSEVSDQEMDYNFVPGDIVSLVFSPDILWLSYVVSKEDGTSICGNINRVKKGKYKWAITLFEKGGSCQIIDVYSVTELDKHLRPRIGRRF